TLGSESRRAARAGATGRRGPTIPRSSAHQGGPAPPPPLREDTPSSRSGDSLLDVEGDSRLSTRVSMRSTAGAMVFDRPSAEPLQVLVVEHRAPVAARLKGHLESLGHHVLGLARAGREAVEVAQRLDPNLVVGA